MWERENAHSTPRLPRSCNGIKVPGCPPSPLFILPALQIPAESDAPSCPPESCFLPVTVEWLLSLTARVCRPGFPSDVAPKCSFIHRPHKRGHAIGGCGLSAVLSRRFLGEVFRDIFSECKQHPGIYLVKLQPADAEREIRQSAAVPVELWLNGHSALGGMAPVL